MEIDITLPFSKKKIELDFVDHSYLFTALRGPDVSSHTSEVPKILGTSIIRFVFSEWRYGTKLSPYALYIKTKDHYYDMKNTEDIIDLFVIETPRHHTNHIFNAMALLTKMSDPNSDDKKFFQLLTHFWESIYNYNYAAKRSDVENNYLAILHFLESYFKDEDEESV